MTELEEKVATIYVLAEKIVHEPIVALWPPAVDKERVVDYADMIKDQANVMDGVAKMG